MASVRHLRQRSFRPAEALGPVFGRDGEVYFRGTEDGRWYIYVLELDSGRIRKFTTDQAVNCPTISPDGRWILNHAAAGAKVPSTVSEGLS